VLGALFDSAYDAPIAAAARTVFPTIAAVPAVMVNPAISVIPAADKIRNPIVSGID
jgi:hypothetical protein